MAAAELTPGFCVVCRLLWLVCQIEPLLMTLARKPTNLDCWLRNLESITGLASHDSSRLCISADNVCVTTCRLRSAESVGQSDASSSQDDHKTKATSHQAQRQALGTPPRYPSPTPAPAAPQATPSTSTAQPSSASQGSAQQPLRTSEQASSNGTLPQNQTDNLSESANEARPAENLVQLVLEVSESSSSVQAILSPVAEDVRPTRPQSSAGVSGTSQHSAEAAAASGPPSDPSGDPPGDESAGTSSHHAVDHQSADSGGDGYRGQPQWGSEGEQPSLAELQCLLLEEKAKTAALMGKALDCLEQLFCCYCCMCLFLSIDVGYCTAIQYSSLDSRTNTYSLYNFTFRLTTNTYSLLG